MRPNPFSSGSDMGASSQYTGTSSVSGARSFEGPREECNLIEQSSWKKNKTKQRMQMGGIGENSGQEVTVHHEEL